MSHGPVWLQKVVKRGGIYGLITCVGGIVVHPHTAKVIGMPGDAESSSYLMFIGFCLTAIAKPLQQLFHDVVLDTTAPSGDEADYAEQPSKPEPPGAA